MRFAGAFVGAVAVVLAMLVSGLKVSGRFPSDRAVLEFQNVEVLSESKRRDFAELLEAPQKTPTLPSLEDIPALEIRHRQRGFVQAEVSVDRAGRVTDVDIIGATPPGVYEQRAIEELRASALPAGPRRRSGRRIAAPGDRRFSRARAPGAAALSAMAPSGGETLRIRGPAGELEALISHPRNAPVGTAVVCHPNPLQQGTLHNKVVFTLARAFERAGIVAVRFNFRGVGSSAGRYGGGIGEADDARSVGRWLEERWPALPRYAAGFSFGAMIATSVADSLGVRGLLAVAPPASRMQQAGVTAPQCPWLVIQGDRDTVTPLGELEAWLESAERRPELQIVAGADHFFHGRLGEIASSAAAFLGASGV